MIATQSLTKRFGSAVALTTIDLQVARGACVGLGGQNGGGRTTLLRLLATLIAPTSGRIEIDGLDAVARIHEVRARLMYVGHENVSTHGLRAHEHLEWLASARRVRGSDHVRVAEVLSRAGVPGDAVVDSLSLGLRQRLALAGALMLRPPVLLFDDPLRPLDRDARTRFIEWIREVRDAGTTIVVALNDERDERAICHEVVHLEAGRLVSRTRRATSAAANVSTPTLATGEA